MSERKRGIDWREERRLRAIALHTQRWKQVEIAEALGVSKGAISQWIQCYDLNGRRALRRKDRSGAPSRLSEKNLHQIPELLSHGAESYGFRGELWTYPRVAYVIEQEFGVRYNPRHVGRLMKVLNWTPHKPAVRAEQRNEAEIERWLSEKWPRFKKSPDRKKNHSNGHSAVDVELEAVGFSEAMTVGLLDLQLNT